MTATAPVDLSAVAADLPAASADKEAWFSEVREGLRAGRLAPYLGSGLVALTGAPVPATPEALADFLGKKVALPRRARGNAWAAAQYIESQRHRDTLVKLMAEAFAAPVPPLPIHHALSRLPLPLIVDTWYDGAMRAALAERWDWGEIQGITRAGIGESRWYRAYDAAGAEAALGAAEAGWTTLLYKPHGSVVPARNFLIADSDYVEVLTEIDIQSPIPEVVKARRADVGFVFLGCRFHDQLLRTYARQILKRSGGPRYIVVSEPLTRNERRFLDELGMRAVVCPLREAAERLSAI